MIPIATLDDVGFLSGDTFTQKVKILMSLIVSKITPETKALFIPPDICSILVAYQYLDFRVDIDTEDAPIFAGFLTTPFENVKVYVDVTSKGIYYDRNDPGGIREASDGE